ncbi:unnamed protein product, partial [Prorocentrum cordatum]
RHCREDDADLAAAAKIRGEEASDFAQEEKELTETLSAIQRAIGILERLGRPAAGLAPRLWSALLDTS